MTVAALREASTKVTCAAPRERASMPIPPEPAQRQRARVEGVTELVRVYELEDVGALLKGKDGIKNVLAIARGA